MNFPVHPGIITAAPILANPRAQQTADRVRDQLSRPGYAIPLPDVSIARMYDLSLRLAIDLDRLARGR